MDMLYHTKERNDFCAEWIERNGENGEGLYAKHQPLRWKLRNEKIIGPNGPTGTDYLAYIAREKLDSKLYKLTDRSLFGARAPFVKVYKKEEKLDGMSEEELARHLGMDLLSNTTECSCDRFETETECLASGLGCQWRPLFESCHPPEMIDDGLPICETTEPPTMSPSISIDTMLRETEAPTVDTGTSLESDVNEGGKATTDSGNMLVNLFKVREHQVDDDVDVQRKLLALDGGAKKSNASRDSRVPTAGQRFRMLQKSKALQAGWGGEASKDSLDALSSLFDTREKDMREQGAASQGNVFDGHRHLLASTESSPISSGVDEFGNAPLVSDLQGVIANAESRDFTLDPLLTNHKLDYRAGAAMFRQAASKEVNKQNSEETHRLTDVLEASGTTGGHFNISPGLQMIVADHEMRDFILRELSNHPSLEGRFGAKLFHDAVMQAEEEDALRQSLEL